MKYSQIFQLANIFLKRSEDTTYRSHPDHTRKMFTHTFNIADNAHHLRLAWDLKEKMHIYIYTSTGKFLTKIPVEQAKDKHLLWQNEELADLISRYGEDSDHVNKFIGMMWRIDAEHTISDYISEKKLYPEIVMRYLNK